MPARIYCGGIIMKTVVPNPFVILFLISSNSPFSGRVFLPAEYRLPALKNVSGIGPENPLQPVRFLLRQEVGQFRFHRPFREV